MYLSYVITEAQLPGVFSGTRDLSCDLKGQATDLGSRFSTMGCPLTLIILHVRSLAGSGKDAVSCEAGQYEHPNS